MSFLTSCPQRLITTADFTIGTWLPVTLECGHTSQINWTPRVGESRTGCIECQRQIDTARVPAPPSEFIQQVMNEIDSRKRYGLILEQTRFRCTKFLLQHPDRIPTGIDIEQAADFVEEAVS